VVEHLDRVDLLKNAPVIFQERIPPFKDIRVTVVGERLFAAESESHLLDWRTDESVRWVRHELTEDCSTRILALMRRLRLDLGSFDFRMRRSGEYVFFEVNPNGQFLFLEIDEAELPITSALADFLLVVDSKNNSQPELLANEPMRLG
jgi:hypothetical protein